MPMSNEAKRSLSKEQRAVYREVLAIATYHHCKVAEVLQAARKALQAK